MPEPADPWDARSLEWITPNPTPHHNFDEIPVVTHLDEFWHRKYAEDDDGRPVAIASTAEVECQTGTAHPHLPAQSYWPITLAFGLPVIGYGLIFNLALAFVGGAIVLVGVYGWVLEPSIAGGDDDGHGDDHADAPDGDADPTPPTRRCRRRSRAGRRAAEQPRGRATEEAPVD